MMLTILVDYKPEGRALNCVNLSLNVINVVKGAFANAEIGSDTSKLGEGQSTCVETESVDTTEREMDTVRGAVVYFFLS